MIDEMRRSGTEKAMIVCRFDKLESLKARAALQGIQVSRQGVKLVRSRETEPQEEVSIIAA
jgi:hypothetical protein